MQKMYSLNITNIKINEGAKNYAKMVGYTFCIEGGMDFFWELMNKVICIYQMFYYSQAYNNL